jgi:hypothetical protein
MTKQEYFALIGADVKVGLCAEYLTPNHWFPKDLGISPKIAQFICSRCPLQEKCVKRAVEAGAVSGVWGGLVMSQNKLRELKRQQPKPVYATCPHGHPIRDYNTYTWDTGKTRQVPSRLCKTCRKLRYQKNRLKNLEYQQRYREKKRAEQNVSSSAARMTSEDKV